MNDLSEKLLNHLFKNRLPDGAYPMADTANIAKRLDVEFNLLAETIKRLELLGYVVARKHYDGVKMTEMGHNYYVAEASKNKIGF